MAVDLHGSDAVSRPDSPLGQGVGQPVYPFLKLAEGKPVILKDDGRPLRHDGAGDGQEFGGIHAVSDVWLTRGKSTTDAKVSGIQPCCNALEPDRASPLVMVLMVRVS